MTTLPEAGRVSAAQTGDVPGVSRMPGAYGAHGAAHATHTADETCDAYEATYEELFDAHFWGLVRLARLLGADDPEDLAQEAFVRLHRKRNALRDPEASLAYLRSTICNLSRNRLRHLRMARTRYRHLAEPTEAATAEAASADRAVVHGEAVRELLQAIKELPRRQRETVVLRYWLDLSERQTAEALGVATGTVKAHTARAMAALSRKLEERK